MKVSCSTRVPMILGAITSAKSISLVFTSNWSLTDPAAWTIPRTGLPPSRMWSLSQAAHLLAVGDIDTGGGDLDTEAFDRPDRGDGREVGVIFSQCRPTASRWDDASAQQRDVPCSTFGEVGGHHAAERSCSAGDDIGRIRGELGGERFRQAAARAQPRDEGRSAADRDLIFGPVVEKVLADARGGFGAVGG